MMKQTHTKKRTWLWTLLGMGGMLMAAGGAAATQWDGGSGDGADANLAPDPAGRAHRAIDEAEETGHAAVSRAADAARNGIDRANDTAEDAGEAVDEVAAVAKEAQQKAEDEAAWAAAKAREVGRHAGEAACENSAWAGDQGGRLADKLESRLDPGPHRSMDSSCQAL